MKYAVIDIGSNSVRLMYSENGNTIFKRVNITRLADKISLNNTLNDQAIERTAQAVSEYYFEAKALNCDEIYAFATAAVRQSSNPQDFTNRVKQLCGLEVEIIGGDVEAFLGAKGALKGKDGGIIDIGGASSEVIVIKNGQVIYSHSLDMGAVKLKDAFDDNYQKLTEFLSEKIKEYGDIPKTKFYGIGGTATSLSAVIQGLCPYDPKKNDGYFVSKEKIKELSIKLINMPTQEREKIKGLQPKRANVIASGGVLMSMLMEYIGIDGYTVSESDNLEGYLSVKMERK